VVQAQVRGAETLPVEGTNEPIEAHARHAPTAPAEGRMTHMRDYVEKRRFFVLICTLMQTAWN
jgi:hypothetical protein